MTQPAPLRPHPADPAPPGPARLSAAVDVIVGHLRRLVLLQAWAKWEPKLTQVRHVSHCFFSPCLYSALVLFALPHGLVLRSRKSTRAL